MAYYSSSQVGTPGVPGTGGGIYVDEIPSGVMDGANTIFILSQMPINGTLSLHLNGIKQKSGVSYDYTISGTVITYNEPPQAGDTLYADYQH
jgi:hypothetical protein